jgi:hypothetical protein
MSVAYISNTFNQISQFLGLPPMVFICAVALFIFLFFFGLMMLLKLNSAKNDLIVANTSLYNLKQIIELKLEKLKTEDLDKNIDNKKLKFVLPNKQESKFVGECSNKVFHFPKIDDQNINHDKFGADFREEKLPRTPKEKTDIKATIIKLLKISGGPISYSTIAKNFSNGSRDFDFEFILNELEQLRREGEIVGQVSAGKLYFRIK